MTEEEQGSDRRFPVLGIFLIFVALAVVGLSILIGSEGAPKHEQFDWTLASVFGTALGTTLLAVATGGLAWSTRSEVRATQKLADLTKHDQDTRERPIVIQQAANVIPSQSRINVSL